MKSLKSPGCRSQLILPGRIMMQNTGRLISRLQVADGFADKNYHAIYGLAECLIAAHGFFTDKDYLLHEGWLSTWPWLADSYADKDYLYEGRLIVWL